MALVSVTDLIARVRFGVDADGSAVDPQWVTDAVILRELNVVRPRLDAMVARAGHGLYELITITGGTDVDEFVLDPTGIAPDVLAIVGVWIEDVGDYRQLRRADPNLLYESTYDLTPGFATKYYLRHESNGDINIVVRPVNSSGTIAVKFVPAPLILVTASPVAGTSTDSVRYPEGWEEWLVLEVQRVLDTREESLNTVREQRKVEIEREIDKAATDRLWAQGPTVRDVRGAVDSINSPFINFDPESWYWL